jgi:hypothetical protein
MATMRRCLAALLVLTVSCASSSGAPATEGRSSPDPNVISKVELQNPVIAGMDALKAIRFLRPSFFRTSGPQSFSNPTAGGVQFSEDFGPLRPLEQLAAIRVDFIVEVRYLQATEAQARFGLNANGGPVIVLLNNKQ